MLFFFSQVLLSHVHYDAIGGLVTPQSPLSILFLILSLTLSLLFTALVLHLKTLSPSGLYQRVSIIYQNRSRRRHRAVPQRRGQSHQCLR